MKSNESMMMRTVKSGWGKLTRKLADECQKDMKRKKITKRAWHSYKMEYSISRRGKAGESRNRSNNFSKVNK